MLCFIYNGVKSTQNKLSHSSLGVTTRVRET